MWALVYNHAIPQSLSKEVIEAMKFGLRLIGYLGDARELVRLAVLGEQAGFD